MATVRVGGAGVTVVSEMSTEFGLRLHVGSVAPLGPPLTEQASATLPVKPLVGATVMDEVPLPPAVIAAIVAGLGVRVKLGPAEAPETAT